jgi:16S rRNA (adenine1518-N6/adenine1519-N6)-dimethyltransferase
VRAADAQGAPKARVKHVARKRFGQNFLVDASVIAAIVEAIGVDGSDTTVEIGPGLGAMTEPLQRALSAAGARPLQVVELDRDLVRRLAARQASLPIVLHQADALAFDFTALATQDCRLRIVGNLPYNISSPLLFHLLDSIAVVRDQHFMLQKEVVERMTAEAGQAAFGRLSVMLQVHYRIEHLFDVPPESFDPPPKVTSAIVRMIPDSTLSSRILDATGFASLVAAAFGQRRKMLRNTLFAYHQVVPLEQSGISPTARAEDVSAAQYVDYANRFASYGLAPRAR